MATARKGDTLKVFLYKAIAVVGIWVLESIMVLGGCGGHVVPLALDLSKESTWQGDGDFESDARVWRTIEFIMTVVASC